MHIFVKIPSGETIKMEVEGSETIKEIKAKIEEKTGLPAKDYFLMFGHSVVNNDKNTLSDCNIHNGSTLEYFEDTPVYAH